MNIIFTIPDQIAPRVVDALALHFGYEPLVTDASGQLIANPQTKGAFVKQAQLKEWKRIVVSLEGQAAQTSAINTSQEEISL